MCIKKCIYICIKSKSEREQNRGSVRERETARSCDQRTKSVQHFRLQRQIVLETFLMPSRYPLLQYALLHLSYLRTLYCPTPPSYPPPSSTYALNFALAQQDRDERARFLIDLFFLACLLFFFPFLLDRFSMTPLTGGGGEVGRVWHSQAEEGGKGCRCCCYFSIVAGGIFQILRICLRFA